LTIYETSRCSGAAHFGTLPNACSYSYRVPKRQPDRDRWSGAGQAATPRTFQVNRIGRRTIHESSPAEISFFRSQFRVDANYFVWKDEYPVYSLFDINH
jgi:hypothetical protein